MEFVGGETLENLMKRSDRLELRLALEIATQAAAGLAAVHKQKLVHRDIKPSNIMVSLEVGGAVTAKSLTSAWPSRSMSRVLKPRFQPLVPLPERQSSPALSSSQECP